MWPACSRPLRFPAFARRRISARSARLPSYARGKQGRLRLSLDRAATLTPVCCFLGTATANRPTAGGPRSRPAPTAATLGELGSPAVLDETVPARSNHHSCRRRVGFCFRRSSASSCGRLRLARCDPTCSQPNSGTALDRDRDGARGASPRPDRGRCERVCAGRGGRHRRAPADDDFRTRARRLGWCRSEPRDAARSR